MGRIISVNVGGQRTVEYKDRQVTTGIFKEPVTHPVRVAGVNLTGDDQADRRVHGGFHKAVYAYASEDYSWWSDRLGRNLAPGMFGENLTTEGMDIGAAVIGQRWRIGDVVLEVSEPRLPCSKLGMKMGDQEFRVAFGRADRPGSYLRIIEEGTLAAGDKVELGTPPDHGVTVAEVARIHDRANHEAARLVGVADLSEAWLEWAQRHDDV